MLEILIAILLATAISAAVKMWIKVHRLRMEGLRFHREQFFAYAERILKDGVADDAALERVRSMALEIDSARQFDVLVWAVGEVEKDMRAGRIRPTDADSGFSEWYALLFNYFLAVSYLRGIRGVLLRATMARVFDPGARGRTTGAIDRRVHAGRLQPA